MNTASHVSRSPDSARSRSTGSPRAFRSIGFQRYFPEYPRLTPDEEQDLARLRISGDQAARERLILSNIALAADLTWRFRGGAHVRKFDDLFSIALDSLILATDEYRPGMISQGRLVRFSTYAGKVIVQKLNQAMTEEIAMIRIPRWTSYVISRLDKGLSPGKGCPAGHRELAEAGRKVMKCGAVGMTGADDEDDILMFLVDGSGDEARESSREKYPELGKALERLEREHAGLYRVIKAMFLDGDLGEGDRRSSGSGRTSYSGKTMAEVGAEIGCSRESIGKLRARGIKMLRGYIEEEMRGVAG